MGIRRMGRLTVQLVALAALGGCGLAGTSTAAGPTTGGTSLPSSSTSSSPPPSVVAAAAPAPATGTGSIAAPTVVTGSGDATVHVTKPAGATTVIATITGNAAGKHFYMRALDGEQDVLVETTAPYSGSTLLDPEGGSSTQIRVWATGPWSITLADPRSGPVFSDSYSGTGDAVLTYRLPVGVPADGLAYWTATSPEVKVYSDGSAGTLIRASGPFNGTVGWPFHVGLVAIRAAGPWSVTVDHRP